MGLEEILERAKRARKGRESAGPRGTPQVVSLPGDGHITEYQSVPEEDIAAAQEAHRKDPGDHDGRAYLAFLYYASKRYEDAARHFRALLEGGFRVANQHFYLGNCCYQQGERAEARRHWEASLSLSPAEGMARLVRQRLEWVREDREP